MLLTLQRANLIYTKLFAITEGIRKAERNAGGQYSHYSKSFDIRELFSDVLQTVEQEEKIGILPNFPSPSSSPQSILGVQENI
ncbi:hypothetical protein JFN88_07060 [Paenibacillus sp. MAHUQ-46]|uniref:Uncharacterized protein n=2 Tax=Paenibacillus TaxID=44249 RepID=A0A934MQ63_9BACL|nr:hypothetical protein [Paenibacillus roseus]MBJ6361074.1 hypothetical protein [Paenibacillus roseus]